MNHLEEMWSKNNSNSLAINPLQSLLNNIRRGDINYYNDTARSQNFSTSSKKLNTDQ